MMVVKLVETKEASSCSVTCEMLSVTSVLLAVTRHRQKRRRTLESRTGQFAFKNYSDSPSPLPPTPETTSFKSNRFPD